VTNSGESLHIVTRVCSKRSIESQFNPDTPHLPNVLVCSNHHQKYGVDSKKPDVVFDKTPSFASLWRYESGMHKLDAWDRIDRRVGTKEMRELLQTVAYGTTE